MLYEAERHESLTATAWNEQAARACINEILDDAVDKFSARDLWPSHPLDSFSPDARWNLYIGAAGTIWALHHLSPKPDSLPDFSIVVPRLLEPNRSWILNVKGAGLDLRTPGCLPPIPAFFSSKRWSMARRPSLRSLARPSMLIATIRYAS